jgi:hypothetical protein
MRAADRAAHSFSASGRESATALLMERSKERVCFCLLSKQRSPCFALRSYAGHGLSPVCSERSGIGAAYQNIEFTEKRGEVAGIIGRNGAGNMVI